MPIVCCPKLAAHLGANQLSSSSTSSSSSSTSLNRLQFDSTMSTSHISIRPLLISQFNDIQNYDRPVSSPQVYFTRPTSSHNSDKIHSDDPLAFAGENGRPKPSEAVDLVNDNGTLLFTLRGHSKKRPTTFQSYDQKRNNLFYIYIFFFQKYSFFATRTTFCIL